MHEVVVSAAGYGLAAGLWNCMSCSYYIKHTPLYVRCGRKKARVDAGDGLAVHKDQA
jgi:hypothetical protein